MDRCEKHQVYQLLLWVVLLLASFAFASDVSAVDLHDPSGSYTNLLDLVKNSAAQWDGKLRGYAKTLFWLLASIQFVWTFMPLLFRQADFGEIVGELIRFIMVIGFFYALLLFSAEWAEKVVNSFRTAAASAAGLSTSQIRPGHIFGIAVELTRTIGNVDTWNPLTSTMVALSGLLVLLCFVFIAAFMGLTIIESYVVINASVLFMGFGSSQWTREYALAIVRYSVSVGAKLFVLTLMVGLIVDSAKTWQAVYNHDDASMWTMVGLAFVCAFMAKHIPEIMAGMISGTSMGGGSTIGGMAAAGAAGSAAAIATIATAGAAAPAAVGVLGAASSGGALSTGAAAGGGLAAGINASFAGGGAPAAAATEGSAATASGFGASTGGQAAAKGSSSASTRVGGSAAPQSMGPAPQQSSNGVHQTIKQAGKVVQGGDDNNGQQKAASAQTPPASNADTSASSSTTSTFAQSTEAKAGERQSEDNRGGSVHLIASGITRGAGILSAIAVPGMESAAGLSLGAGTPQPMPGSGVDADDSMAPSAEPQNIIRPAEPSPASPSDAGQAEPNTNKEK